MEKLIFTNNAEIDDLLRNLPDTQTDIFTELRDSILSGKYEMNSEKIIERILWHGVHFLRMSERLTPDSP